MLRRAALLAVALSLVLSATASAAVIKPPLRTSGSKIVDRDGHTVVLQGVNWFGFETSAHVPHGLWSRDLGDMMGQIRQMGFNTIRLPFSLQALDSTTPITGPDFSGGRERRAAGQDAAGGDGRRDRRRGARRGSWCCWRTTRWPTTATPTGSGTARRATTRTRGSPGGRRSRGATRTRRTSSAPT